MRDIPLKKISLYHIFLILLLAGAILRVSILNNSVETLVQKTVIDDSFYSIYVAEHMAQDGISAFDGTNPTNGYQPLWIFLLIPFSILGFNVNALLYIGLYCLAFFSLATAVLIFKIAKKMLNETAALVVAGYWLLNPYVSYVALNGLETALYAFFFALSFYQYLLMQERKAGFWDYAKLGFFAGISLLARMDAVFLILAIVLHQLWKRHFAGGFSSLFKKPLLPNLSALILFAFLASAPWFIWSYSEFGTISQASADFSIFGRMNNLGKSASASEFIMNFFTPAISSFFTLGMVSWAGKISINPIIFAAVFLFSFAFGISKRKRFSEYVSKIKLVGFLVFYSAISWIFYAFLLGSAGSRYSYPVFLVFVLLSSILFFFVISELFRRLSVFQKKAVASLLILLVLSNFYLIGTEFWKEGSFPWQIESVATAKWLKNNTPQDAVVGTFNAGIVAFFSERKTINLDGKINNPALKAREQNRLLAYINGQKIGYLVDYPQYFRNYEKFMGGNLGDDFEIIYELPKIDYSSIREKSQIRDELYKIYGRKSASC